MKVIIQNKNNNAIPFLKWAGGKRQLLPEIRKYIPKSFNIYYEPFVGAGALLFDIQPSKAVINDINKELIITYEQIRDNIDKLIDALKTHRENHSDKYYYAVREKDRVENYLLTTDPVEIAARMIYLNRTCFNGLYRVNSKGYFNVPLGKYKNPNIVNENTLRAVHNYFNSMDFLNITDIDFKSVAVKAEKGDFVYFDPPYDPVSQTSSFTSYNESGFNKDDQIELANLFKELDAKGVYVLLSNSDTEFINDLYSEYRIEKVAASRNINSNGKSRGKINEILVIGNELNKSILETINRKI